MEKALPFLVRGASLDSQNDAYLQMLASAYVARANALMASVGSGALDAGMQEKIAMASDAAIAAALRATQVNPLSVRGWITLAQVYEAVAPADATALAATLAIYGNAASLEPINPAIPTYIGGVHKAAADRMNVGNAAEYAAAEDSFKKALVLKPDYIPAKFSLGVLYYEMGRTAAARNILEETVLLAPDYANALYFLGLIYDRQGDRARAIIQFERVAQLNPESAEIKMILANLYASKPALSAVDNLKSN
jgi:tetratricopeptide (TPR) repeat protein